jgi:hypothetical protein
MFTAYQMVPWDIKVYRKPTHTNLGLNSKVSSPYGKKAGCALHPGSQDQGYLQSQLPSTNIKISRNTFQSNPYSKQHILQALSLLKRALLQCREDPTLVAFLNLSQHHVNCIWTVLSKHNIRTMGHFLSTKFSSLSRMTWP